MIRYIITGRFEGVAAVEYNEGLLALIDLREATLTAEQVKYLTRNMPLNDEQLLDFATSSKLSVKEQDIEVNFDLFYERFGLKKGKAEAKRAFERLSKGDQVKAYLYISTYNRDLKLNAWKNKMYPATYIHKKAWED